ncbi:MAG: hypothetical protein ACYCT1_15115, partial [Steroidobacteraceae bacterium]
ERRISGWNQRLRSIGGRNFMHLAGKQGRVTAGYIDVTQRFATATRAWGVMTLAMPDLRQVFASPNGAYVLLIGWRKLPEDVSRYSRFQAESELLGSAALSSRTINAGAHVKYTLASGTPVAVAGEMDYVDGGTPYRDAFVEVIATKNCLFSMKLTGERRSGDNAVWSSFSDRIESARRVLQAHEGVVAYSSNSRYFTVAGLLRMGRLIGIAFVIGGTLAFFATRRFRVVPGTASLRYSIIIVSVCTLGLALLGLKAAFVGATYDTYDGVALLVVPLILHLYAWITRTPRGVLVAVSYMVGSLISNGISWALGWMKLPTPQVAIAVALGIWLLWYVCQGSLCSKVVVATAKAQIDQAL